MQFTDRERKKLERLLKMTSEAEAVLLDSIEEISDEVQEIGGRFEDLRTFVDYHLVGPQGEQGEKGDKGDNGNDGRDGQDGSDGKDGRDGRDGKDGESPEINYEKIALELPGFVLRDSLEAIEEEEDKLSIDAISGLREALKKSGGSYGGVFNNHGFWAVVDAHLEPNNVAGYDVLIKGSNRYFNFGTDSGTDGYGIRDNAGTMQFKNSAGAWTNFGAGGGGGGTVESVVEGTGISIDATDPANPIISTTITQYTDENAQDAIGAMVDATLIYTDGTPVLKRAPITGDISIPDGSNTASISAGVIVNADINASAAIDATKIADGSVSSAKFQYLSGVTSDIQTQLDAKIPLSYLDVDGTLSANSDVKIATQKAVKTFVENAVTGLLDFKGSTDASANPNYPVALKGDAYVVSVAGKIGGASGKSVEIGDVYLAIADNAGGNEATVGTSWIVLEHNLQGALLSANNLNDVGNVASARSNLGLVAGGTGDIWVEKAGDTMTGALVIGLAGLPLTLTNTTDNASVQAGIFQGDRANPADGDEAYISLRLSDDAGTQTEVSRISWVAVDVNAGTSVDGRVDFAVMTAGSLADELSLDGTSLFPVTNDGLALGKTNTNEFSDFFLASGAVFNWANSDVLMTHSSNALTISGGRLIMADGTGFISGHSGQLGIGGVSAEFEVFGTAAADSMMALGMFNGTGTNSFEIAFYRSKNGSIGTATVVASGDQLGKISWYGAQQTGTFSTQTIAAQIRVEVAGTVTSGASADMPGKIILAVTPDASGTLSDRLTIDSAITAAVDIVVPDEAYATGWNGSLEVPTKNAVYDKIEGSVRERKQIYVAGTTWNKPTDPNFKQVIVWVVGGGGGGGGAGTNSTIGGGGGGGAASYKVVAAASLGSTETVTVGVAGTAGASGNNSGGAGGTSSFGAHLSATGGAAGGPGSGSTTAAGGTASGGTINGNGSEGGASGTYTDSYRGYGGSAGVNQGWPTLIQDSISLNIPAAGVLGQWAAAGSPRSPSWSAADYTGGAGASFGGGGSGGQRLTASRAGGAGAQGVVVVIEQYY